jgi:integrase
MAIIRSATTLKGYSIQVASRVAKDVRSSSATIYDHKWKVFSEWCLDQGLDKAEEAPVTLVADFLEHLFTSKGLEVSTVKGYRAAIAKVLKHVHNVNISQDFVIQSLISNFELERPVNVKEFPKWDLTLVLKALTKPPYEPLASATDLHLTRKTSFLLLLASGARRGELHAIDMSQTIELDGGLSVLLKPNLRFMAKNFNPGTGKGFFEGFKITQLITFTGSDLPVDNLLCPVRALNIYVNRTRKKRMNISQLLIACNLRGPARPAHKNSISNWTKNTIADAYGASTESMGSALHRSTHEIRALSASLALLRNCNIEAILKQCRWANQSTFTSFYLREARLINDNLFTIPPLMAAGEVITKVPPSSRSSRR